MDPRECVLKARWKKHKETGPNYSARQTLSASGFNILTFLTPYPVAVFQNVFGHFEQPECGLKFCPWPLKGSGGPMNSCMQATEVLAVTPVPRILRAPTATSSYARNVWLGCLYVFHGTNQRDLQICVPACLNIWNQEGWWKGQFQRRVVSN